MKGKVGSIYKCKFDYNSPYYLIILNQLYPGIST